MMKSHDLPMLPDGLSITGLMFFFGVAVALYFLYFIATKLKSRGLAMLLGVCLLLIVPWFLVSQPVQRPAMLPGELTDEVTIETQPQAFPSLDSAHVSTEQMFEHFHRNRIPLDKDEQPADSLLVATKPKESVAKNIEITKVKKPVAQIARPDWVSTPPKRIGNVYREVVSAGPYKTIQECNLNLDAALREVVQRRISQLTSTPYAVRLERLGLGMDFVLDEICNEEWVEVSEASFGEMKHAYVLMEFDAAVDDRLRKAVRDYRRQYRIEEVGIAIALVLSVLAGIYGLLKVDTWTRGYYTKRLFFGAPAAIIAVIVIMLMS